MSLLASIVVFLGKMFFWKAVFQTHTTVNGFTMKEIILYFLIGQIVSDITHTTLGSRISELVIDGTISNMLIKPLKIRLWLLSEEIGHIVFRLTIKLLVFVPIYLVLFGSIDIELKNIPLFVAALLLSFLLTFSIYFMAGILAFWFKDVHSLHWAIRRTIYFLAGAVIPLSFVPDRLRSIINILPFKYIFDFPINNLTTGMNYEVFIRSLTIQLLWILIFIILSGFMLNKAIKQNESVGI
jgi:ABC-2 type transport system permease protein